ncbi:MAG: GspH/FimT family pseudopilin [Gammaproteobacteria bacterium]|jgi:type IV fimbrial biogenesis protein FimT
MKDEYGFTLIELMTVVALVAIMAMIAFPAYSWLTTTNRMASEINDFTTDVAYARSEAVKRGQTVTLCASSNSTGSNPSCTGGPYTNGWIVFNDINGNGTVDAGEDLLKVHSGLNGGDTLTGNSSAVNRVTYNNVGMTSNTGKVYLHSNPDKADDRRCLTISTVGNYQLQRGSACP